MTQTLTAPLRRERDRLLARIHRRYETLTETVCVGRLSLAFTRIADPNRVLDMVADEEDRLERLTGRRVEGDRLHLPYWAELWDSALGLAAWMEGGGGAEGATRGRGDAETRGRGGEGEKEDGATGGRGDGGTVGSRSASTLSGAAGGPPFDATGAGITQSSVLGTQSSSSSPLLSTPHSALSTSSEALSTVRLSVLDLGCGMGLAGTTAAALGAHVLFADLESPALLFARLNSLPWHTRVRAWRLNWQTDRLGESFDRILGADILYERAQWPFLETFWRTHLRPGGRVLLGEPGRQTGSLFVPWIRSAGWALEEHEQPVETRSRPIRIFLLRAKWETKHEIQSTKSETNPND